MPLAKRCAPTWLGRELASGTSSASRDAAFGREVRTALAARHQWLIEQQLTDSDDQRFRLRANALDSLRQRDLKSASGRLSQQLGIQEEKAEASGLLGTFVAWSVAETEGATLIEISTCY